MPKPEKRDKFHAHLKARGPITRENAELIRIADETGYSADHLFKIAIGAREPSTRCRKAIERAGAQVGA